MIKIIAKSLVAISNFTFKVFRFEIPFIAKYRRNSMQKALDEEHKMRDLFNAMFKDNHTTKQAVEHFNSYF